MGWGGGRRRTGNDCFQKDLRWMRAFLFPFPSPFFFFFFLVLLLKDVFYRIPIFQQLCPLMETCSDVYSD